MNQEHPSHVAEVLNQSTPAVQALKGRSLDTEGDRAEAVPLVESLLSMMREEDGAYDSETVAATERLLDLLRA